jgi:adenylate cyclase
MLAFWSLFQRHHFRIPLWEGLHLILGLAIPPLVVSHVVGTRLAHELYGTNDSYTYLMLIFWELRPDMGVRQVILLMVVWAHSCISLHYWLRLQQWYVRFKTIFITIAILFPVLVLAGLSQAGREVSHMAQQFGWIAQTIKEAATPDPLGQEFLASVKDTIMRVYGALLALTLIARAVRHLYRKRHKGIRIHYPPQKEVVVPKGFTVLEASRKAGIPHASVCGGRGRCSTCRVRVLRGFESLPPMSIEEQKVLDHIGAPENVRLACQLRPANDLSVIPILQANPKLEDLTQTEYVSGSERQVVVLFADLRGFTTIAEHKLPYDVVFLLNQYFELVGDSIDSAGGIANQFTGDGAMALFGLQVGSVEGCRQALTAASELVHRLADLSHNLTEELDVPLRMGIGIHTGPAVVGQMGHGMALYLTAVGDTVHVASRLQELTKEYDCQIIISDLVAERAGIDVSAFERHELIVRNRREPIVIRTIDDVEQLLLNLNKRQ